MNNPFHTLHKTHPQIAFWSKLLFIAAIFLPACGLLGQPQASPEVQSSPTEIVATNAPASTAPTDIPASVATDIPEPTSVPATASVTVSDDPKQAIIDALTAATTAGPYHVDSTSTTDSGTTTELHGDVILPDKIHVTTGSSEILVYGDKTYTKVNGAWQNFDMDINSILSGLMGAVTDYENVIQDAQFLGEETINGVDTRHYSYTSNVTIPDSDTTIVTMAQIWVSTKIGLPVQMVVDGEFSGIKSHTVQTYTFDPTITIEEPVISSP